MDEMAESKNLMRRILLTAMVLLSALIIPCCAKEPEADRSSIKAVNGILDLTNWDFDKSGIVSLDGEWEFYWEDLLQWSDFQTECLPHMTGYIEVPRSWNKYPAGDSLLSGDGYATYRLLIKTCGEGEKLLGLKLPRMFTAYSLSCDNKILASNGKTSAIAKEAVPQYRPQVVTLRPENSTIELIIQVSNFSHRSGGILESIKLGTTSQIIEARENQLAMELFLFGCLAIIGIYHIVLFMFRRKNKTPLYFGLYCLLVALRTLFVGEIFITQLFPGFNWEIQHKIQTSTYYLGVPVFTIFLCSIFNKEFPKWALKIAKTAGICFTSVVLLTPVKIFTIVNPMYQLLTFFLVVIVIYTMIHACAKKRAGAFIVTAGGIFFLLTVVNDMLFLSVPFNDYNSSFLRSIIKTGNLSSAGLIALTFTQAVVLAMNTSKAYTHAENISERLLVTDKQKNELLATLEDRVRERTLELEESNIELEKAYNNLSLMEKARKQMLTNISHDLKTPMTLILGYTEAILDGMFDTEQEQREYLKIIQSKITGLSQIADDLSELSLLESRQIELDIQAIAVKSVLAKVDAKFRYDAECTGLSFYVDIQNAPEGSINVDINKIDRVFSNLIYNALKYTTEGEIKVRAFIQHDDAIFEVSDTGRGISPEDLPYIFDRFYTASKSRSSTQKSSGLGLAIAKEIVEFHSGSIWADSLPEEGSSFFFSMKYISELHRH